MCLGNGMRRHKGHKKVEEYKKGIDASKMKGRKTK
jgi:hypothetical protein